MKRLSRNCAVIKSSELKYGWTFEKQLERNPAAKKEFPDRRMEVRNEKLVTRSISLARGGLKLKDPELLRRAAEAMAKATRRR